MAVNHSATGEKRDFTRMKINSLVDVRLAGNKYQAVCKNLSGAGMSIESDQPFEIGSELQLSIAQENDKHQPFIAAAVVTRVEAGENGKILIGLSFQEIFD